MRDLKNTRANLLALGVKLNLRAERRLLAKMEPLGGDLRRRFWNKVKIGPTSECWEWNHYTTSLGYGQYLLFGRKLRAHRVAYIFFTREIIPEGLFACHSCDNKKCCNPRHIWLGTNRQNQLDAAKKGLLRPPRGENCHWSKLTNNKVLKIRKLISQKIPERKIAKLFGVSYQQINKIKLRQRWNHI